MWQQIWFIINTFFVASLIAYLFVQRSYTEARRSDGHNERRVAQLNRGRITLGAASIVLFVMMSVSFLIHMRVNG